GPRTGNAARRRLRAGLHRQPSPAAGKAQRLVCRTRPRRADRLERSAVRSARSAKARRTLSHPAAARPRQQRAGVA
ncbi:DNA polymerase II, partial [Klebsiella pneumoniae]